MDRRRLLFEIATEPYRELQEVPPCPKGKEISREIDEESSSPGEENLTI